jgi:hypothetical protein
MPRIPVAQPSFQVLNYRTAVALVDHLRDGYAIGTDIEEFGDYYKVVLNPHNDFPIFQEVCKSFLAGRRSVVE